jgi:hypothetical protein
MADIIPFPASRTSRPAAEQDRELPLHEPVDRSVRSHAKGTTSRLEMMMQEIADFYEVSSVAEHAYCRFDTRDMEEDARQDMGSLTELIVFSPEIQFSRRQAEEPHRREPRLVQWGDVFFKSEDVYPFLFTVYTEGYVQHQLLSYGESIKPTPRDIIIGERVLSGRKHLSAPDIIRAVLKWVNLYAPQQSGKPVRLESEGVLQDLICEPGVEVVVVEPS